ncbi:helix-turn-helix transcriptional regulator [Streptomyces fumanus]|uniref:Transcriptional regulator n=1 Tax=Streptomyces fumanus TaxID=67302 RepID=A0A919AHL6_9ACTN|nr:LuxR family transcriptional regulator [Streptomyces fumanus]GHF08278.1 transcriptional regulator [Streptomyces fumanus]
MSLGFPECLDARAAVTGRRDLVERDAALTALRGALADAAGGRGRLVVVEGPLGSGKSRLVHEFLETLEPGAARVLRATASLREEALPFGVLTQLSHGLAIPPARREPFRSLLAAAVEHALLRGGPAPDAADPRIADAFQKLTVELAHLAENTPLVICVDNAHYVDVPSLHFLAGVVAWLYRTRILVLVTDDPAMRRPRSPLLGGLAPGPHVRRVPLAPLSRTAVHSLATRLLGPGTATARLTAELYAVSGGNPLAVRALIVDQQAGGTGRPEGYGQALLDLVAHARPPIPAVVRSLAVLGGAPEPADVAPLAGQDTKTTRWALRALAEAGVLRADARLPGAPGGPPCTGATGPGAGAAAPARAERYAFRHPAGAAAVLDDLPAADRAALHRAAAELLRDSGASALAVARQLTSAGDAGIDDGIDVLLTASQEALAAGDVGTALGCLGLARRTRTDGVTAARVRTRLSRLERQWKPQAAVRHLRPQLDDFHAGLLDRRGVSDLVLGLTETGALHDLTALLDVLRTRYRQDGGPGPGTEDIRFLASWAARAYPLHTGLRRLAHSVAAASPAAVPCHDPWLPSAVALSDDYVDGRDDRLVQRAELLLSTYHLDHDSLWNVESGVLALRGLCHAGKLDEVVAWCEKLEAETAAHQAVASQARFLAVRVEAHLRRGDLVRARDLAAHALSLVPPQGWGVGLAGVLACAVLAATRSGDLAAAERYVALPLPEHALHSRHGAAYLHARGHYRLATHHPQAALADFLACGRFAETWGRPGADVVPWRLGAAEAWLAQSDQEQAKRLVREQLARLHPGPSPERGQALRTLAAVSRVTRRPQLLTEAVDMLMESSDEYELTRALIDLSAAFRDAGDQRNARRVAHRAWHLAKQTGTEHLCREAALDPVGSEAAPAADDAADRSDGVSSLTRQERRIAALASKGYTNREIAAKLYITASTVEQHLTRVFRKVNVKRRQDLPYLL